ncbi:hypothetical protein BDZ91DRAFT_702718 [Kalaharituber pfeilii]|nr:hypothetical protein BDZ91DRAFT_702718 [Kalaharituber pfeilii]
MRLYQVLACASAYLLLLVAAQDIECSKTRECYNKACCHVPEGETKGLCSYEPEHCEKSKGCVSNCNAKAECGTRAAAPGQKCPLQACCSKGGFCGTTRAFCEADAGCQSNCITEVPQPSCTGGHHIFNRRIAYYESWAADRDCDAWLPERIPARMLTHVIYSFALISEDHEIELGARDSGNTELIARTVALKNDNPHLKVYIGIGGWAFNNPPTQKRFSNTASTAENRKKFCKSLMNFMTEWAFDGVDIDWEYPVAEDRGGKPEDKDNFVKLIAECRMTFDESGKEYGLTFTIPRAYWYLRHFDIQGLLDAGADWANLMSYDLHGVWDKDSRSIGNSMAAHTNLTEIKFALDLLWRNNIEPADVVLGFGFYGCSFQASSPFCTEPGCEFVQGAQPGSCTNASGILSYAEIKAIQKYDVVETHYVEADAVNYMVYERAQWVSYDDAKTFSQKVDFAKSQCLGGLMIWAIDLDTYDHQALEGLLGRNRNIASDRTYNHQDFGRFTGEDCYVTECVSKKATCKPGYNVLEYVHDPVRKLTQGTKECDEGDWRLICCPSKAMPVSCEWTEHLEFLIGFCFYGYNCDEQSFSLMKDNYDNKEGSRICFPGKRDLCCLADNSNLNQCHWGTCAGDTSCGEGEILMTESGYGASKFYIQQLIVKYENCEWVSGKDGCTTEPPDCPKGKIMIAEKPNGWDGAKFYTCLNGLFVRYCCDVPYDHSDKWPVDPRKIFPNPQLDDVSWEYDEEFESNAEGQLAISASIFPTRTFMTELIFKQDDAFGLVLMDGAEDSFQGSFGNNWVFMEEDSDDTWNLKKRDWAEKRSLKFRNDTFDNEVEHFRVFCPHGSESELCTAIFKGRVEDTIIGMPPGIGAGPYAHIVRFEKSKNQSLSRRALRWRRRNSEQREDVVYDLVVDYDFASINGDGKGPVQFRVDFTNLVEYWDAVTTAFPEELKLRKRWFGTFKSWLSKVTDIEKEDKGAIDMRLTRSFNLFHFEDKCVRGNSITKVQADLDASMDMGLNARYAYYFHGHILPTPKTEEAFAYFGIQPVGNVVLRLSGEGSFQSTTKEIGIIKGLAFPGLSVKGLVRIGPELDVFGRMDTYLRISGEIEVGVSIMFKPAEVYFPQNAEGIAESHKPEPLSKGDVAAFAVKPDLNVRAQAEGQLSFTLTPMALFGIDILNGALMKGDLSLGLANTLTLGVSAEGWAGTGGAGAELCYWADYNYDFFIRGEMTLLNGRYDWGGEYSVMSNDDPLVLAKRTCKAFGDADEDPDTRVAVQANSEAFSSESGKDSIFPVSFGCELTEKDENDDSAYNDCWSSGEDTEGSRVAANANSVCYPRPSVFYNCHWFRQMTYTAASTGKSITFPGICDTISEGIKKYSTKAGWSSANWVALVHYKRSDGDANRDASCGRAKGAGRSSWKIKCKLDNRSVWKDPNIDIKQLTKASGEQSYSSCDEFPFNTSEEGGRGAVMKCVPQWQQDAQGTLQGYLPNIQEQYYVRRKCAAFAPSAIGHYLRVIWC